TKALKAIKAADLLLRDGNFPLVIVDLILNSPEELRKIPQTTWYRLQRLVESVPTACLVLTRYGMVNSAQLKLVLENSWNLEILLHYAFTLSPFVEATAPGICTVQFTDHRCLQAKVVRVIEQFTKCEISSQAGIAVTPDLSFLAAHLARPVLHIEKVKEFLAP